MFLRAFLDITIRPDFGGIPPSIMTGLTRLTNDLAAVLIVVSGIGIVLSLIGLLIANWLGSHALRERFQSSLLVSVGAGALLFVAVAASNYATGLFRA